MMSRIRKVIEIASATAGMLFAVLLSVSAARAQTQHSLMDVVLDRKELRVGVELKYPPLMYKDASGEAKGFEVELARVMCKTLEVKCTFVDMEFPSLIPALQSNKIDIIVASMAITPQRAKVVDFCKPFNAGGTVVVVKPSHPLSESATRQEVIDTLNKPDIRFAVQLSTVEAQVRKLIFPDTQTVDMNGPLDAFLQIISGRAEATLIDPTSALVYAREHPGTIKVLLDGIHQPYLRISASGGGVLRGNGDFCRWVDVQVQDWINSGEYAATYLKEVGIAPSMQSLQQLRGGY